MRIAHISDCYLPRLGGIEAQVQGLGSAQVRSGDDVHVITATPARHYAVVADPAAKQPKVHRLTFPFPWELPLHPFAVRVISRTLRQVKPDVVHIHVGAVSQFAWAGMLAARTLRLPVLVTVHSMWGPWSRLAYRLADYGLRLSSQVHVSAVGDTAAELVRRALRVEVSVIGNGVDLSAWQPADRRHGDRMHMVCATRFAARKRVLPLLHIAVALRKLLGDRAPRLSIAGDGPGLARARAYVARHGISDTVALPGRLSRQQLAELYAAADAYIQLSVRESFGIAAVEARASGLPVLGRSGNGFAQFVESGVTGYLEKSDALLQARIVDLVSKPELLERLRENARNNRPAFDWDITVVRVAAAYAHAMAQRLR